MEDPRDITERKRAELARRERDERFRAITDSASDAIIVASGGKVISWNAAAQRMFLYTEEEAVGQPVVFLIPEPYRTRHVEAVEHLHATGEAGMQGRTYEAVGRRKDGTEVPVEVSLALWQQGDAHFAGAIIRDITERKRAEKDLTRLNQRNELLLCSVAEGILGLDLQGNHTFVNPAAARMLGYNADELLGRPSHSTWHHTKPDGSPYPREECQIYAAYQDGTVHDSSSEVFWRKDGTSFPVQYASTPVYEEGRLVGAVVTFEDITERRQASAEREQYFKFFQGSGDLMAIADPNGAFKKTNPACTAMLGYSEAELCARPFIEFVHPDDRQPTLDEMARQLQRGYSLNFENRYVCKDGSVRWLSWRAEYRADEGLTYASARDITERKQAEEALRESEEKFHTLAEAMPQIVWMTRPDGWTVYYNVHWVSYTGLTLEESYGHGWTIPFHPEDRTVAWDAWRRATTTGGPYSLEARLRRADGVYRWWLIRGVPLRDADGTVIRWLGTCTDIDDVKQAEEEKVRLEAQLQQAQKMESVGRLAGGVAHDFNNMLSVIMGYAELALDQVDASHPLHKGLVEIAKASRHSADLTNQLLAFARKQTAVPKVLDLNDTVAAMLKMLQRLIGEDIDLIWAPDADLWPVKIDPTQIGQILANLCVNARDAISGVGRLVIETGHATLDDAAWRTIPGASAGDYVVLAVSDSGAGMAKDVLDHIFEPFFTTKGPGRGTGLGLSTVYGIVTQNAGFIAVSSEPGIGTTFRIHLPRHAGQSVDAPRPRIGDASEARGETVLLVEDDPSVLDLATTILNKQGYTVLAGRTPENAIRLAREHPGEIHLVLTDVVMPVMNGRDLVERVVAFRPAIKSLFMSGYTADVITHRGLLEDGVHLLQKPFAARDLAAAVRDALAS